MLTFTVVGGGFAGIEALAELEDMTRYACRYYDNIKPEDIRWVLVEAAGRILPRCARHWVSGPLSSWKAARHRGVPV